MELERMFRLSEDYKRKERTLKVEGRLTGPWVGELEKTWQSGLALSKGRALLVDLTTVIDIDAEGKALLKRMYLEGARFRAAGCLTCALVEEIAGSGSLVRRNERSSQSSRPRKLRGEKP